MFTFSTSKLVDSHLSSFYGDRLQRLLLNLKKTTAFAMRMFKIGVNNKPFKR